MANHADPPSPARTRPVRIGAPQIAVRRAGADWYVDAVTPLAATPPRVTDWLVAGAARHPGRTLVAQRGADGAWLRIAYGPMLERARCIGQALLDRGLNAERPLMIVSGNDLQHCQLALGALYAGVPYVPVSPAYSLLATDFALLRALVRQMTPGALYASDGERFGRAIRAVLPAGAELILDGVGGPGATRLHELLATAPLTVDAANTAVGPGAIAKFLFTSGSTREPRAVVTTHRMLTSNQQMLLQTFPFLGDEPPVLVDWLPWHHTFRGSHNLGIALANGGTLYLDGGRPLPGEFAATVATLTEIAPTVHFNVPKGWEMLTAALERDRALRDTFYSRVRLFFCAGAGLSGAARERLDAVTLAHCGESIRIMTGLGMTETSPASTFGTGDASQAGHVGVPAPGCRVRLVPVGPKLEARFKGPHVMPGYWRDAAATTAAFDEQGYYRTGDALRFLDPARPELGFLFDGRLADDFKLGTGTFVDAGALRGRAVAMGAPCVQDVVVTGSGHNETGLLVFPCIDACRALSGLGADAIVAEVLDSAPVRAFFRELLGALNAGATGSSHRIAMLRVEAAPPSVDAGELTDKGTVSQSAVLARRAVTVAAMHDGSCTGTIRAEA